MNEYVELTALRQKFYDVVSQMDSDVLHIDAIIDIVENMPSFGWISVDDALPEPYTQVIVTWINHSPAPYYMQIKDKPFTSTAVRYCGSWYWWNERIEDLLAEYGERSWEPIDSAIEITHWMPLPEPWRETNGQS